jgi:hypothetical protein
MSNHPTFLIVGPQKSVVVAIGTEGEEIDQQNRKVCIFVSSSFGENIGGEGVINLGLRFEQWGSLFDQYLIWVLWDMGLINADDQSLSTTQELQVILLPHSRKAEIIGMGDSVSSMDYGCALPIFSFQPS